VIRMFDITLSLLGLLLGLPLLLVIYMLGLFGSGSPLFFQVRVGRFQKPFTLIKFRTMRLQTQSVATHLVDPNSVTKWGAVLRKTKLDELPQLLNVLIGDMSLVGPRPCLYSQTDLIRERLRRGVFNIRPGITGFAQLNGIDMSTPVLLAEMDATHLGQLSVIKYFSCVLATITGAGYGDRIRPR
jgi:O-antigen biosynthesis protein WbqP